MACSGCQRGGSVKVKRVSNTAKSQENVVTSKTALPYAEKTEDGKPMVELCYMGGGYSSQGGGCRSCGGTGVKYTYVTTETIQFVSEDSADGMFKRRFSAGHCYLVTEEQAKYLLTLSYRSKSGRTLYKFKKKED